MLQIINNNLEIIVYTQNIIKRKIIFFFYKLRIYG